MLPYGSVDTLYVSVLILLFYNSIIFCAIHITHGMVAMDSSEDVPTPCAEKPGEMSYSSASMDTDVADGMEVSAVANSTHMGLKPMSFIMTHTSRGIITSLKAHR